MGTGIQVFWSESEGCGVEWNRDVVNRNEQKSAEEDPRGVRSGHGQSGGRGRVGDDRNWDSNRTRLQERVLTTESRRVVLNCTRQWGKSTVTAAKAVHQACTVAESLTLVVSPSGAADRRSFCARRRISCGG